MVRRGAITGASPREGDPPMSAMDFKRRQIARRGIPVTGNDIDTDRIIPARF